MKKSRVVEIIREEIQQALNEIPYIGGQYDVAYKGGKVYKGILQRAIDKATQAISTEYPELEDSKIASMILSIKARKSEDTPPAIKKALMDVDKAIQAQEDTFEDRKVLQQLQDLANQPKSKVGDIDFDPFLSGEKSFTPKLGGPQTARAVKKLRNPGA